MSDHKKQTDSLSSGERTDRVGRLPDEESRGIIGLSAPTVLRLAIVDADAEFRKGVRLLLELQPHLSVVAEAGQLSELADASTARFDAVLVYAMAGDPCLTEIRPLAETAAVIVITPGEHREGALTAIRLGARAVVFKRLAIDSLVSAIDAVAAGHVWIPPTLQAGIVASMRQPVSTNLTAREIEITRWVARGLRNAEIGTKLFISEQTVKTHLNNIFQKIEVRDRVELTLYATRTGIADLQDDWGQSRGRTTRTAA
jgi:DNA-binding NarL/FixJ family response regulator